MLEVTQLLGGRAKFKPRSADSVNLLVYVLPWLGSTWLQTLHASFASLWCSHLSAYTCKNWALDRSPNLLKWSTKVEGKLELSFPKKINLFQDPLTFHNILTFKMITLQRSSSRSHIAKSCCGDGINFRKQEKNLSGQSPILLALLYLTWPILGVFIFLQINIFPFKRVTLTIPPKGGRSGPETTNITQSQWATCRDFSSARNRQMDDSTLVWGLHT